MSKFCKHCGSELNDNDIFCANCGGKNEVEEVVNAEVAQDNEVEAPAEEAPVAEEATNPVQKIADKVMGFTGTYVEKAKKDPKIAIIGIGAVVAVLVLAIVLSVVFSGPAYKGAIDNYFAVISKGEFNRIEKMAPKEYWDYMEEEMDMDIDDYLDQIEDNELYDTMMEFLELQYGDNIQISYKILEADELSKKKLDTVRDGLKENYDIAKKSVTEGYKVEVEATIKGDDDEESEEQDMIVVKISGNWYVVSEEGTFEFGF